MKQPLLIICFIIISLSSLAQDKICSIPKELDPSFLYIQKYMPEYYYESHVMKSDPKLYSAVDRPSVKVRVMRNYVDDKTFTYLILRDGTDGDYVTLFTDEIPSLISYLERIISIMNKKPEAENYYVYNSRSGLLIKTQWSQSPSSSAPAPLFQSAYYYLFIYFPNGDVVKLFSEKDISNLIYRLEAAKQFFPPAETDFLYDVKKELKDNLEVKDVDEVEYKEI